MDSLAMKSENPDDFSTTTTNFPPEVVEFNSEPSFRPPHSLSDMETQSLNPDTTPTAETEAEMITSDFMEPTTVADHQEQRGLADELNTCKGRLEAFGNELKLLLAEVTIITDWVQQKFGIQLINQNSLLFKHIYDAEEIEEIAAGMGFPENRTSTHETKPIPFPGQSITGQGLVKRGVGRPRKNPPPDPSKPKGKRGRKPGWRKYKEDEVKFSESEASDAEGQREAQTEDNGMDDDVDAEDWSPQACVETMYEAEASESPKPAVLSSRPRRASTKRVNYADLEGGGGGNEEVASSSFQKPKDSGLQTSNAGAGDPEFIIPTLPGEEEVEGKEEDVEVAKPKPKRVRNRKKAKDKAAKDDGDKEEEEEEPFIVTVKKRVRHEERWESKGPKQCDECGKVVKGSSSLKKHKMMHADERPYPCPQCDKRFRDKKNVKIHLIALHDGERHLQCSFCGRKFYAPKDLRIHERTHTGDKPYACQLCPKRFNVKEHLTMHIRVHTGERPYVCPTCGKAFSQANSLRIHKKIHLRPNPPKPRRDRRVRLEPDGPLVSVPTIPSVEVPLPIICKTDPGSLTTNQGNFIQQAQGQYLRPQGEEGNWRILEFGQGGNVQSMRFEVTPSTQAGTAGERPSAAAAAASVSATPDGFVSQSGGNETRYFYM